MRQHLVDETAIDNIVTQAVSGTKITDIHTHIYSANFGPLLLWGIDELLDYHYLVAETMRWSDMPYDQFWAMSKHEQADYVWKTLFIEHSPISESCRGVLTTLDAFGLDTSTRNLAEYRAFFDQEKVGDHIDRVFELAGVESVVMTNDPFDLSEREVWESKGGVQDPRFHAALRLDGLLNSWEKAMPLLKKWGYNVEGQFTDQTYSEVRRFLADWINRMNALYMAVSLPPDFAFPEDSSRGRLLEHCVIPAAREAGIPFALMIGVKKLVNLELRLAGDSVGKSDINVVEYLCAEYPDVRFMVTMLSRENQHELCIAARKFRNLMVFGCWWFLNNPSLIEEISKMRFELLGMSFIPQHSDARVLDQLVYKWSHSRKIIADMLSDYYKKLAATGWKITEEEIRRDVSDLFGGNFWRFVQRR
ncbi:MAG TPA: glucuronate isomerase [Armatimonadota bacterium]|nr:glucuronate isomerase [Armatimonadota bacterium]HPP74386.1 glucuronate isomerase [Armatimonadota bacterium]